MKMPEAIAAAAVAAAIGFVLGAWSRRSRNKPAPPQRLIGVVHFHTIQLFYLARTAALRAREDSKRPNALTDDALVAVVMAAFAAEAFINEVSTNLRMYGNSQDDWNPLTESLAACAMAITGAEGSRSSTKEKFKAAAKALDPQWRGAQSEAFQDFGRLLKLRDAIVHLKPEAHAEVTRVTEELGTRVRLGVGANFSWFDRLQSPEVAVWAVSTARRVALALLALAPDRDPPQFDQLHWPKDRLREFPGLDGEGSRWPD